MTPPSADGCLRSLGTELGSFLNRRSGQQISSASLQAVIADLAADQADLVAPLKDLVSRRSFRALIPHALSGGGAIQRDALVQEISRVYHPTVLIAIEEVLNGFLESSGGIALQLSQSVLIEPHPPITKTDDSQLGAGGPHQASHLSMSESDDHSQQSNPAQSSGAKVDNTDPYFDAAIHIASIQGASYLGHASAATSYKGLVNYVIRDSAANVISLVALEMVRARLRSLRASPRSQQRVSSQVDPPNASDHVFQQAVELARRLGNGNLDSAAASNSSAGLVNYIIRDGHGKRLAVVPLSMLRNVLQTPYD